MSMWRFCTLGLMLILTGNALGFDLELKACISEPAQITDIKFVTPRHAFITTQSGDVYWFRGCNKAVEKISTINVATSSWELGLYSIAIAPDFFFNPIVYLYYASETDGRLTTRLSAFKFNPYRISDVLTEERILLEVDQPFTNSNGGALVFGADGLLYLGVGDGGSDGDPDGHGQNTNSILGSIVRIKPDYASEKGYSIPDGNLQDFIPGALPEILAYGVRNPWKFTFDSRGSLIIGDVGEHRFEEVDVIHQSMIGVQPINLGWSIKEGNSCFKPAEGCDSRDLVNPVYEYEHGTSGNSITGGETVRIKGKEYYLFGDFMIGKLSVLDLEAPATPVLEKDFIGNWTTFAKDPWGGVYVADYSGGLYQVRIHP